MPSRPTNMRQLVTALILALATIGAAQSTHFDFKQTHVRYATFTQSYSPSSEVTGVTIIRSQKDWNAYWAALHGRSYVKNMVAPTKYDFNKEQLIAITLPQRLGFNALPQVDRITKGQRGVWQIDVSPVLNSGFAGASRWIPYVIVRTPKGPDDLDIVLHGSNGDVVLSTRSKRRHKEPERQKTSRKGQ